MEISMSDFFVHVSVQLLYYTYDLNNRTDTIQILKKNYNTYCKSKPYTKEVERYLLKRYKYWLVTSKVKHQREINRRSLNIKDYNIVRR